MGESSMSEEFDWSVPPLDPEDQRLVDAYVTVGVPVDQLPYTEHFEKLFGLVGRNDTQEARHFVLKRLIGLRKMGRFPRFGLLVE
jgi:hypothetical protein